MVSHMEVDQLPKMTGAGNMQLQQPNDRATKRAIELDASKEVISISTLEIV